MKRSSAVKLIKTFLEKVFEGMDLVRIKRIKKELGKPIAIKDS